MYTHSHTDSHTRALLRTTERKRESERVLNVWRTLSQTRSNSQRLLLRVSGVDHSTLNSGLGCFSLELHQKGQPAACRWSLNSTSWSLTALSLIPPPAWTCSQSNDFLPVEASLHGNDTEACCGMSPGPVITYYSELGCWSEMFWKADEHLTSLFPLTLGGVEFQDNWSSSDRNVGLIWSAGGGPSLKNLLFPDCTH